MNTESTVPVPPPGCPAHATGEPVPLHGAEFAADPQAYYEYMRHYGPTAPVELAPGVEATLVTDYSVALQLLQNAGAFRKDSRRWRDFNEGVISPDSPVLPLLAYRPNAMFSDGADHMRLRQAITDSFARVDSHWLSQSAERVSNYLIAQFNTRGSADLLNDYAKLLPLFVFNELFGCPAEIGDRVLFGISGIFDGVNAEKANEVLGQAVGELVALKRTRPGDDVTSWLMQHQARLTNEEMAHQLVLLLGAGAEPLRNLISNTLHLLLTNDRYAAGGLIDEAIDTTLWKNPPMANYAPHYPAADMEFGGQKLAAGDLVLVSFAAANTDPALAASRHASSNRSHLAWSAGPHACPAKDPARLITVTAIENLFNRLPDVELAVPEDSLTWRPGPFNRALAALPARFTPVRATRQPDSQQRPETSARGDQGGAQGRHDRGGLWSSFLSWWKA
ncbi:cytochrome P450 [Streptomyces sp. NPDC059837]|jgi:cytochrome P450|uniref:cytochrome P450 n=1 Tax=unclassified Streptomyces TaxID=2593676 RepID=UPI002253C442|nr:MULTISPECIES: cytochrome P450 [unclassified Streptomyces]MCX4406333.1 cytochrome P450 [Streptomyces sp. NBC_01764]MCX5094630.1 cytochrome P450 [Streptomyces sp. NBC_00365]MCX5189143.1 cytochrome P450 [Streptomyces sp. NBC_00268]